MSASLQLPHGPLRQGLAFASPPCWTLTKNPDRQPAPLPQARFGTVRDGAAVASVAMQGKDGPAEQPIEMMVTFCTTQRAACAAARARCNAGGMTALDSAFFADIGVCDANCFIAAPAAPSRTLPSAAQPRNRALLAEDWCGSAADGLIRMLLLLRVAQSGPLLTYLQVRDQGGCCRGTRPGVSQPAQLGSVWLRRCPSKCS